MKDHRNAPANEIISRRSISGKGYEFSDGSSQYILYPCEVHYRAADGTLREINNELVPSKDEYGRAVYAVKDSPSGYAFASDEGCPVMSYRCGARGLQWRFADSVSPVLKPVITNGSDRRKAWEEEAERTEQEKRENILQYTSVIRYEEIMPGTTYEYELSGTRAQETIRISDASGFEHIKRAFTTDGDTVVKTENGAVTVTDRETGEKLFGIGPAYLKDSSDRPEIKLSPIVEASEDGFTLTYELSDILSEEPVYPVTIDPEYTTGQTQDSFSDTTLSQKDGSTNFGTRNYCETGIKDTKNNAILIKAKTLPDVANGETITKAELKAAVFTADASASKYIAAYNITNAWSETGATWSNFSFEDDTSGTAEAMIRSTDTSAFAVFDLTSLTRKWYSGKTVNNGVCLRLPDNNDGAANYQRIYSSDASVLKRPVLVVDTVSHKGISSIWTYDGMDSGRSGAVSADLYNGSLHLIHADAAMTGERMPVSVTHYYDSAVETDEYGCGRGWRTNWSQRVDERTYGDGDFYIWTDGTGNEHRFAKVNAPSKDTEGLGLTLTRTVSSGVTTKIEIKDKQDTVCVFKPNSALSGSYYLENVHDVFGNADTIAYADTEKKKPLSVTDAVGRTVSFGYNGAGRLVSVSVPCGEENDSVVYRTVSYAYDNEGGLAEIHYHDITGISGYSYNTDGKLIRIDAPDGTLMEFAWDTDGRVQSMESKAVQTGSTVYGAKRVYAYLTAETHVTHVKETGSDSGKRIIYRFNENGNVESVRDEMGYARFTGYSDTFENKPEDISSLQRTLPNLIRRTDYSSGWTVSGKQTGDSAGAYTNVRCNGTQSMRVKKTSASGTITISRDVKVVPGRTYTYSAYIQGRVFTSAQMYISIKGANDADWTKSEILTATVTGDEESGYSGWKRLSVKYTAAQSSDAYTTLTVRQTVSGGVCEIFYGCPQLTEGETPEHADLISNGDLRYTSSSNARIPLDWETGTDTSTGTGYGVQSITGMDVPEVLTGNMFLFEGKPHIDNNYILQESGTAGSAGDEFILSCWLDAKGLKADSICDSGIRVQFYNGSSWSSSIKCMYDVSEPGWRYGAFMITAPAAYTKVRVMVSWRKNINTASFANISLYKESYGTHYAYDANGNTTSRKNKLGNSAYMTYDSYDNLTAYAKPGHSTAWPYTIEYGGDTMGKYHLPMREKSSMNVYTERRYHESGVQIREKRVAYAERDDDDPTEITTETGYSADHNYALSTTDSRGNVSTRTVNAYTGTTERAAAPDNTHVDYSYDSADRVTGVESDTGGGANRKAKNGYTYTNDRLTQVKHNTGGTALDVVYTFGYDALGANTAVSVGNQAIVTKTYSSDRSHALLSETLGNGGSISYTYDDFNRLTEIKLDSDDAKKVTYTYGNNGKLGKTVNSETGRTTEFRYDLAGRAYGMEEKDSGGALLHSLRPVYDAAQNLDNCIEKIKTGAAISAYKTRYEYDRDDRIASTLFGEDSDNTRTNIIYDSLGRISQRVTYNGSTSGVYETYTYAAGSAGYSAQETTALITGMSQSGMVQSYAYDVNGRITSWTCNGKACTYVYDGIGQLIRVNDEKDTRADSISTSALRSKAEGERTEGIAARNPQVADRRACGAGTTWSFEYDNGGNILQRKKYAYTTGTLPSAPLQTISYSYDADWKDKLISYNGTPISSDNIGNFTNDGTWSYAWVGGRRLASMAKAGMSIACLYDENGQRIRKSVTENGTTTVTDYTVTGKSVTHVRRGTDDMHIYYANGRPSHCRYNGNTYTYVYSLQGDVLGLRNASGTLAVTYLYDAWGKEISRGGSLANTLGAINPFRYRGYVYDEETGLYYLRSRYYDPDIGRFISSDSILGQVGSLLQHNLFCYCENRVIQSKDENGRISRFIRTIGQNALIVAILLNVEDVFGREILGHWFYGKGKDLVIEDNEKWNDYLKSNDQMQDLVNSYYYEARRLCQSEFEANNIHLALGEEGIGGYYTGYDLINGSNTDYGGFSMKGYIYENPNNGKNTLVLSYEFHDRIDPNLTYFNDFWLMIGSYAFCGGGDDYTLTITGTIEYEY